MAPLPEEETLGKKHRKYNVLVNEAIKNNPNQNIAAINHEDSDLDNLFKIDIACNNRNVEYVLQTLKCDDMLYVSRVIKQSTWLLTEQEYSHIINPVYLHSQLSPQMTTKAFNKLILHIRLNLRDEQRVEDFFNYYKQIDLNKAFDWLLHCSIPFIEQMIRDHADEIPRHLWKRLFEKSFTCLEILLKNYTIQYYKDHIIEPGLFLLNRNHEKFLDIIESLEKSGDAPTLGPKYTKIVMEKNSERIKNNLEKYAHILNIPVFAKYLKQEEIQGFILKYIKNKETRFLFTYKKMKYFLNRLPFEERFDFVNKLFIEKSCTNEDLENETWDNILQCILPLKGKLSSLKNIYIWYVYAPFDKALTDLKQLIRKESNPNERLWMVRIMLTCAGRNQENVLKLIKYYHENHINEAFLYKVQFVNHLITNTDAHRYDEETWGLLNYLFNSLEVFTKTKDGVETCVKYIVLYNLFHDKNIPEVIENKFNFRSYIAYEYRHSKNRFNSEEREKIFNYLYKHYVSKIAYEVTNEDEFNETVDEILNVLLILDTWNKDIKNYPLILQKIKNLAIIKKEKSWRRDLSEIYNFRKSWRKALFPESIILSFNQNSCINALKHNPEILKDYWGQISSRISDNKGKKVQKNLNWFHRKVRIYWHQSLAKSFKTTFLNYLNQINLHKSTIKALCAILSPEELQEFAQRYAPKETKIISNQVEDIDVSIRKSIASCMHLSRPHPAFEIVLLYAKKDYLKYVLPSLNAIFHNMSCDKIREHIPKLLNSPVSLQKHGIRVAFTKLSNKELVEMFQPIWKSSKNKSIRNTIFCETFKAVGRKFDETAIFVMWEMLNMLIDELTFDENKKIYTTMSKIEKVHLCIRPAMYMKSYNFFKKLPSKANCEKLLKDIKRELKYIIEFLEVDFMLAICLENFDENFTKKKYVFCEIICTYLLSAKSESMQNERYAKLFVPLIDKALDMWNETHENVYYTRNNLFEIFIEMSKQFEELVLHKKMVFPIGMYKALLNKLCCSLSMKENYLLLTYIKLSLGYIQGIYNLTKGTDAKDLAEEVNIDKEDFRNLPIKAAASFGKLCSHYLNEDIANYSSSIHVLFANALNRIFDNYNFKQCGVYKDNIVYKMTVLKYILESSDLIEGYVLVTQLIPTYQYITTDDVKSLKLELLNKIASHKSEEVMHRYARSKDLYF